MPTISLHSNPPMTAGGNISPCRFVKQDTSADLRLIQCSSQGERPFGISGEGQRTPPELIATLGGSETAYHAISGEGVEYYTTGQYCLLECGTAWTRGARLTTDANGKGETAASADFVGATALRSASAGEFQLVRVESGLTVI